MGRSARAVAPIMLTLAATAALCGAAAARVTPAAEAGPDFVREVLPIFSASCIRCHGPGESKALLRLDNETLFREGGDSGEVVVPGDPARSLLYKKVTSTDPKHRMPQEAEPLAPAQVETLRRWIESGAAWPAGTTIAVAEPRPAALPEHPAGRPRDLSHLSYNRDVRPILAESCFPCHGPDKNARKAGLRLDREEIAKGTLASGSVRGRGRRARAQRDADANPAPGRGASHAAREERARQAAARAGRDAAALDRGRRRMGAALGVHPAGAPAAAPHARAALGP